MLHIKNFNAYYLQARFLNSSGSTGCANQWKQALGTDEVATTSARAASAVEAFFAILISFFITNPPFSKYSDHQVLSVDKT